MIPVEPDMNAICRNSHITRKTSTMASISVWTTSSIEILTKGVVSYGTT